MKVKVIGMKSIDFTNRESGEKVQGTNIFVNYAEDGVDGLKADKIFIRKNSVVSVPNFVYGKEYDFIYEGLGRRQLLKRIEPAF